MKVAWEIFKGLGSIGGIASGAFLLWDRFWRMTPTAVVVMRPFGKTGLTMHPHLSIKNPADRPIIVRWQKTDRRGRFGLAEDTSTRAIASALVWDESAVVIDAGQTRDLPLFKPEDVHDIDPENYIEVSIAWRFAQPRIYKRDRHIRVALPKRSMMYLDPDDYSGE